MAVVALVLFSSLAVQHHTAEHRASAASPLRWLLQTEDIHRGVRTLHHQRDECSPSSGGSVWRRVASWISAPAGVWVVFLVLPYACFYSAEPWALCVSLRCCCMDAAIRGHGWMIKWLGDTYAEVSPREVHAKGEVD